MIKSFTFTNYLGESLTVTLKEAEPSHGLLIRSVEGLGPVVAQINGTETVTIDGSKHNSARRQDRNIVIDFIFTGVDIEAVRQLTYKYFPEKKYITVAVEADHRIAEAYGYVEHNEPNIFSNEEGAQISIICHDPNFYSIEGSGKQITNLFGIIPLFEFPFENNSLTEKLIEFGEIPDSSERLVVYNGEVETGFLIKIHFLGPVSDLTLYNTLTREKMILNLNAITLIMGSPIQQGDDITISTVRDNRYVTFFRSGTFKNALNIVDKNADWFELNQGDNFFAFTSNGDEKNIQITIENKIVYRGI